MRLINFFTIFVFGILLFWCIGNEPTEELTNDIVDSSNGLDKITLYKSPSCDCCGEYAYYLEEKGYDIEIVETQNMNSIKQKQGVPSSVESCHTTLFEAYFVEGHVPIEAVEKLLSEKPNIDGIALAGMPGPQIEPYILHAIKDGQVVYEFMRIE